MIVQNLNFFDKLGKNLNLNYDNDLEIWQGTIYFESTSAYLFDNENLFILEKSGSDYKFPILSSGQALEFSWSNNKFEDEFFIYDVERDIQLKEYFINRVESKSISHSDINTLYNLDPINLKTPLQLNLAFNPSSEARFERTLIIYLVEASVKTKIAELMLYGEGIEEEERFRVWAQNFGIKFLKEDANILKDYDIKEAFPDQAALNQIRKELLVNKDQIYPYIGTYRGLVNFVNILGYKNLLQVKEYWKNINPKSTYFDKLLMVDISDYLDDGVIDTFDLVDRNKNLKSGKQFVKTEFLALTYQFTRATDNYDDDGIPLVEETTEFTVDELFYKLNLLSDKLKNEFLPINVKIKDIIGEFIYFQKYTISYWPDDTRITDYDLNEKAEIDTYPDQNINLVLRNLAPLYRKTTELGLDIGVGLINTNGAKNPFEYNQKYAKSDIGALCDNINEFYNQIRQQRFPNLGAKLTWEQGDDPEKAIGAPVIFTIDTGLFTVGDLKGVKLEDLDAQVIGVDPYWTLENINFRNFYEIEWKITKPSPNAYSFTYRGKISDLYRLPHFLPYAGTYRVTADLYDFYGNASAFSRFITVDDEMKPSIIAFTRLEDKFNYHIGNLGNVQLQDFGSSFIYYPKVNVLDSDETVASLDIYKNLLEWDAFYLNRYGTGQNIYDVDLYDVATKTYVAYDDPGQAHPKKSYWGLGNGDTPITLNDFKDVQLEDVYWLRLANLVHTADFNAGFYLKNPLAGDLLKISNFSDYTIPSYVDLDDLVSILNASTDPGVELFTYSQIGNDPTTSYSPGDIDPSFITGTGFSSDVYSIALQADDNILVGGYFTSYDGNSYSKIIRLDPNGAVDPTLVIGTGFTIGVGNCIIYSIKVQTDGKILVGGNFTSYNGNGYNYIIRLNSDGSIDPTFVIGTGFNSAVYSIELQDDGKILVGGNFTQYDGNAANYIIRLNTDGSIDGSFVTGTGFDSAVYSIQIQDNDTILAGGNFTQYDGNSYNRIIRLNTDGTIDLSFVVGIGFDGSVTCIKLQDDGQILVGGTFANYLAFPSPCIIRLDPDGSIDTSFSVGTGLDASFVHSIEVQTSGKILIGGVFTQYDGTGYNNIVRLNPDGAADSLFNIGTGFNGGAISIKLYGTESILVGGGFTQYNGNAQGFITKLHALYSLTTIHARAKYLSKEPYHFLEVSGNEQVTVDKYSFFLPKKVYSKSLVDYLNAGYPQFDDETLFLHAKTSDILSGVVQDPNYWVTNKYWKFENDEQIGFLPTVLDQNAFNIADIKAFENSFSVPENAIVFFVINNLDGKNDFIWTLTDSISGEEIVRAKSVPFFIWKFKDLSTYNLSVSVFDNRATEYVSSIQNFIKVLDKNQYRRLVEQRLDLRKIQLLKNQI